MLGENIYFILCGDNPAAILFFSILILQAGAMPEDKETDAVKVPFWVLIWHLLLFSLIVFRNVYERCIHSIHAMGRNRHCHIICTSSMYSSGDYGVVGFPCEEINRFFSRSTFSL
jgi:hypothetical protein